MNIPYQIPLMGFMAVAALLGAAGQIFLKRASDTIQFTIPGLFTNWALYGFAVCYGSAVLIQLLSYRAGGQVAIIYPVISLSYVFAAVLAWQFLGESISAWTIGGIATILIGVSLIGYGASI